VKECKRGTRD
jgi:hypothetical protein